jgi:hypothetical protein
LITVDIPLRGPMYWVDRYLDAWAEWMRQGSLPQGLPSRAAVGENYATMDWDTDRLYGALDSDIAIKTATVIDDIGRRHPAQKAALYRAYSILAVYQFPRDNYIETLEIGKSNVLIGLRKRGVWLGE